MKQTHSQWPSMQDIIRNAPHPLVQVGLGILLMVCIYFIACASPSVDPMSGVSTLNGERLTEIMQDIWKQDGPTVWEQL